MLAYSFRMYSAYNLSKKIVIVLLCLLALLITSCSVFGGNDTTVPQKQTPKVPPQNQTYTIPATGIFDFATLDPALAQDANSISAIQMMYTGLVSLNDHLQVQAQLAQSWQVSADGLTWTFHLRPHLKFSDGTPLTSADVAYSINRALQPATKSTVAPVYLSLLKDSDQLLAGHISTLINDSILTPNPQTVVLIISHPASYFLSMLTNTCSYVVEKKLIDQYQTQFTDHLSTGGGAGPFKVLSYTHRQQIVFVPNKNYYNPPPQLQKVTFVFYHASDAAYQAYQNGQVDTTPVPIDTVNNVRKQKDFHQVPQLWINYYAMNYQTKPFNNIHIRQAFAIVINKSAIANNIWKGTVLPTNHIVPTGMIGYNPDLKGPDGTTNLDGNSREAQTLLQQGLQEEHWKTVSDIPSITLTYVTGVPQADQEVSTLVQTWKRVLGITVQTDPVDYNTLIDKVTGATNNPDGIQMWGLSWVGEYPDAHDWLSLQFGKNSVYNNMNYAQNQSSTASDQQHIQQQLTNVDNTNDNTKRTQLYQQAEQQIVNDVGWLPMDQETSVFLRTPAIVGITDNAANIIPPDDWAHIYRIQNS
jgi:oligopeptide transport system substrate-binding protein